MSHDYEAIAIDRTDSVATITLSRPEALNAITPQMLEELTDALRRLGPDHGVKVIVLTGAGRAFSAGVDLKALGAVHSMAERSAICWTSLPVASSS